MWGPVRAADLLPHRAQNSRAPQKEEQEDKAVFKHEKATRQLRWGQKKRNPRKRNKLIRKENVLDHPYRHHIGPPQVFIKETNK